MGKHFDHDAMDTPPAYFETWGLKQQREALQDMVNECHGRAKAAGWYHNPVTGLPIERNVPEMLCLIHSEVSEALEGYRKNLQDTHLPNRRMIEVELADTLIRIFDLAGFLECDLGGAYSEKLRYNATRRDHSLEERAKLDGKKF